MVAAKAVRPPPQGDAGPPMDLDAEMLPETPPVVIATSLTLRESPVTASRYNRWMVGQFNRDAGLQVKVQVDELRREKERAAEKHRKYGELLKLAGREQMVRDRMQHDTVQRQNLAKAWR